MGSTTISALPYALWPLLTLAVLSLWIAAMVDIAGYRRAGSYTRRSLSCVAATVSVVAVIAIFGIGAVFAGQRHEAAVRTSDRAFIFSFGLEHVTHPKPGEPARDGSVTGTR